MTFSQSGFELKNTSDRHATLWLSKIGDIPIRYHREIPNEADIKEVTVKKETTGKWFVCFGLETADADLPEKPDVESLNTTNSVGIDLGILNYIYTTDGKTVDWLDLEDNYERSRREQRKLSRRLITFAEQFKNPVIKLEDLEGIRKNSSWSAIHSWHFYQLQQFITYKAERAGISVEKVDPYRTSKLCSECGSIGTRDEDHFLCSECDRGRHADLNASENIAQREGEPCTA
jgi:putative transposase